jgi:DNA polymerase-1
MVEVVFDIEADGLLEGATKIHMCCAKVLETGETRTFKTAEGLQEYFDKADKIIGHNIVAYDLPMLSKFWDIHVKMSKVYDTLIMSRLENSSRANHSLREWGKTLECYKGDCEDFSEATESMEKYCQQDVEVTCKVYQYLKGKLKSVPVLTQQIEHFSQLILEKQRQHGFLLDTQKLLDTKSELDKEYLELFQKLQELCPPRQVILDEYVPKFKKDGELTAVSKRIIESDECIKKGDKYFKVEYRTFNIDSPQEIVERLAGVWKPVEFTSHGQPKVSEANLETIPDDAPEAFRTIKQCKICKSRSTLLQSYLDSTWDGDSRAHGQVFSIGTKTHRMSHKNPNMANIPSEKSYKGDECREMFTVPEGYKLIGCDAAGIQLRALAHYVNDPVLISEITSGDIHTYLAEKVYHLTGKDARSRGKTITYAILMGAGVPKIASLAGTDYQGGKEIMKSIADMIHGWDAFQKHIALRARIGYFNAIDGSHIPLAFAHYGMSAYLQSFEQALMKFAMVSTYKEIQKRGLTAQQVCCVHDELQYEVLEKDTEEVKQILLDSFRKSGEWYRSRCPIVGECKVGNNWGETH